MARYDTILQTIGHTPLVRINTLAPAAVRVYVKMESFNPMGSIKDRMALAVIEQAERTGALRPGQTVVEATSGNTGIALAMVCAQKGYPLVVTMAENFSVERRKLLRFLGARVVLTPAADKGSGMLAKAIELAEQHGYYLCRQFDNEANAEVHARTTAREILADLGAEPLHYWVSGFGTGGTLKGVASRLRRESPQTRIVATEPDNCALLSSGVVQRWTADGRPEQSHPHFRPHPMQGWSPDFIAPLAQRAQRAGWVDEVLPVSGDEALRVARQLALKEGILAGISGGATLAAALKLAVRCEPGSTIVCMLPDTGERYLSTPLFADISEQMSAEEQALSASTAGYQFSAAGGATAASATSTAALDQRAESLVDALLAEHAVVMFALQWCEFCWSVRKLFDALAVPCKVVALDDPLLQREQLDGKIRQVLATRLGESTMPQVYIGGRAVGGASEVFAAQRDGRLQRWLAGAGVGELAAVADDMSALLPGWLHPRQHSAQGGLEP